MNKKVTLDLGAENVFCFNKYLDAIGSSNKELRLRLMRALKCAVKDELTPIQQQVVEMYYFRNMKISEIALRLCVNKSSVSRLLLRARRRLERALKYVFIVSR